MIAPLRFAVLSFACIVPPASVATLCAQQVTVGTPFNSGGSSFYENFGVGFGFNIPTGNPASGRNGVYGYGPNGLQQGINFGFGGPNVAPQPFGLGQPFSGGQLGYGVQGKNGGFNLNFFGQQGSSTSNVSQTPFVTSMNGYPAYFSDTVQRPFVTGLIPVVGDYGAGWSGPTVVYPSVTVPGFGPPTQRISVVKDRWERMQAEAKTAPRQTSVTPPADDGALVMKRGASPVIAASSGGGGGTSSAERPATSLAEIRRQNAEQQAALDAENDELLQRAKDAVAEDRQSAARTLYERVLKHGNSTQRAAASAALRALTTR
ncbi:MAG: hypothetical protein QM811_15725 [Pirellulales bacterium]